MSDNYKNPAMEHYSVDQQMSIFDYIEKDKLAEVVLDNFMNPPEYDE